MKRERELKLVIFLINIRRMWPCLYILSLAAVLMLLPAAVLSAAGAGDYRTWITATHDVQLADHGCENQAATLNLVRSEGGGIIPLEKNRFFIAWFPPSWGKNAGRRIIISLHGSGGCAERMFKFWHRTASLHDYAIIALQYAEEDVPGRLRFDDSRTIYDLLRKTLALLRRHCPMEGVPVILHGFSKGSARIFELAGLDRAPDGMHVFSAFIADSGTGFRDYRGRLSPYLMGLGSNAYSGARFWLYCGTGDHGGRTCRGMARMNRFVRDHGGTVDALYRYPGGGHGIFITGGPRKRSMALDDMFSYINNLNQ